jgi:hypothetical protein
MDEFKKCNVSRLCSHLESRLSDRGVRKGFVSVTTTNSKTADVTWRGVVFVMDKTDRGMVLNFCPFCGGKPGTWAHIDSANPKAMPPSSGGRKA